MTGTDGFYKPKIFICSHAQVKGEFIRFCKGQNGMTSFNEDLIYFLDKKRNIKPLTETKWEVDEGVCSLLHLL